MKKLFLMLFAVAVLAACKDDDDQPMIFRVMTDKVEFFGYEKTRSFGIAMLDVSTVEVVEKPAGWDVNVDGNLLTVKAPASSDALATKEGGRIVVGARNKKETATESFEVMCGVLVDFEDDRVVDYLAGPTAYGENLYDGHAQQYYGYDDSGSDLMMMVNEVSGVYTFSNGGIAISRWNDMATANLFQNQCGVYYKDAGTGFGGHRGSQTFAVATGIESTFSHVPEIFFSNTSEERVFDHMWVTNSTCAVMSMLNGDAYAKKFDLGDWFKLSVYGEKADGTVTGPVEFYLADMRSPSSYGIVTRWTKVNLSVLGAVTKLKFDMSSSDTGAYGMNTPAYFCFDDIAIRK